MHSTYHRINHGKTVPWTFLICGVCISHLQSRCLPTTDPDKLDLKVSFMSAHGLRRSASNVYLFVKADD